MWGVVQRKFRGIARLFPLEFWFEFGIIHPLPMGSRAIFWRASAGLERVRSSDRLGVNSPGRFVFDPNGKGHNSPLGIDRVPSWKDATHYETFEKSFCKSCRAIRGEIASQPIGNVKTVIVACWGLVDQRALPEAQPVQISGNPAPGRGGLLDYFEQVRHQQ